MHIFRKGLLNLQLSEISGNFKTDYKKHQVMRKGFPLLFFSSGMVVTAYGAYKTPPNRVALVRSLFLPRVNSPKLVRLHSDSFFTSDSMIPEQL